jgi:arylformamidase
MSRIVDLTSPITHDQAVYPGDPPVRVETVGHVAKGGYALCRVSFSNHTGTHADAPSHVYERAASIDQVPLDTFCGPAVLVDLAPGKALDPQTRIDPSRLEPHRRTFRKGARILLRTGWDRRLGTREYFRAAPGLSPEACRWLVARGIRLLALDLPTPGPEELECHRILLKPGSEVIVLEGLRNLDKLPRHVIIMAFPLSLEGSDGAPVRAVARVP